MNMALNDLGYSILAESLWDSLRSLFWEEFGEDKQLKEVLADIIHKKWTPAHRLSLINNSGFSPDTVSYLWNINAGITLGRFEYSHTLPEYMHILNIVNHVRRQQWEKLINTQIDHTASDAKKVLDLTV